MRKVCLLIIAAIGLPMMFSCRPEKSKKDSADKISDVKSQIVGIWEDADFSEHMWIFTAEGEFLSIDLNENSGTQVYGHYEVHGNKINIVLKEATLSDIELNYENDGNTLIVNELEAKFYRINRERYDQLTRNITHWEYY